MVIFSLPQFLFPTALLHTFLLWSKLWLSWMGLMLSWLLSHSLRTKMLALLTLAWLFWGLTQINVLCVMFQVKKKLFSLGNFYNLCGLYNLYGSCFMFYYLVIILTFSLLNFYNLCCLYHSYSSCFIFCYLAIRPPDLPLEKFVCRSGSNSWNWTWNNRLVPNRKRSSSRLYIVTLFI